MGFYDPDRHKKAFENSQVTVFIFNNDQLIGFGRAISDSAYQAAIYDLAVSPEYQGKGIGNLILENLLSRLSDCNVILYANPGKEGFYLKKGFRKMKTGLARFFKAEKMKSKGFTD